MGQYTGANQWINSIYQFDETDVVQGGPDGIDNRPLKDLADRTAYLRARIGLLTHLSGNVDKVGNSSFIASEEGNLITAIANGVNTLTIADASTLTHGALIPITSYCNDNCVMNIAASNGQLFYDTEGWRSRIYMHHKEHLILVALTDHFRVVNAAGNFYNAGEEIKSRRAMRNTLPLQGQLLQRNQYPRLWEYVSSLGSGQEVTSEGAWLSNYTLQGFFTNGDGSTTFRLPDERGMFERMLDAGRGIDYGRYSSYAGGYEPDGIPAHTHTYRDWYYPEAYGTVSGQFYKEYMGSYNNSTGSGDTDRDNNYVLYRDTQTGYAGYSSETVVKNLAKLNLIKF